MLSYLKLVRDLVSPSIYGRGVRLYLEGSVGRWHETLLEFWREYEVYDRHTYIVKTPLIHLAARRTVLDQTESLVDIVVQNTSCTCEYYQEMGVCKHIIAVYAALDQEFNKESASTYDDQTSVAQGTKKAEIFKGNRSGNDRDLMSDGILDTLFEADITKQTRVWESDFEAYLSQSGDRIPQSLKNMVSIIGKNPDIYKEIFHFIGIYSHEATADYNKEKNLVRFIIFSLHYVQTVWVELWLGLIDQLIDTHRDKILIELWIIIKSSSRHEGVDVFYAYLKNLSEKQKIYYIDQLVSLYPKNKTIWLDFIEVVEAREWVLAHYLELDPLTLLRFSPLVSDHQEELEIAILNQVKQWADFLQVGEYDQVIAVFQTWQRVLGRSSYYEEAVSYFKTYHGKKKKLMTGIVG